MYSNLIQFSYLNKIVSVSKARVFPEHTRLGKFPALTPGVAHLPNHHSQP